MWRECAAIKLEAEQSRRSEFCEERRNESGILNEEERERGSYLKPKKETRNEGLGVRHGLNATALAVSEWRGTRYIEVTHPTFSGRGNNSPPAYWDVEITCAQIQDNRGSGDRKVQLIYYYCDGIYRNLQGSAVIHQKNIRIP